MTFPHIYADGRAHPIFWPTVETYMEDNTLGFPDTHFNEWSMTRTPINVVNHWDVCLNSTQCHQVLTKRSLSIHFTVDFDGTIRQHLDTNHVAWHAGGRLWNMNSIGIEINNPWYPKYQSYYTDQGLAPRPIWSGVQVHGRTLPDFLGFYEIQMHAVAALSEALNRIYKIPLVYPLDETGNFSTTVSQPARDGTFHGFLGHHHLTHRKIDVAGMNLPAVLGSIQPFHGPV